MSIWGQVPMIKKAILLAMAVGITVLAISHFLINNFSGVRVPIMLAKMYHIIRYLGAVIWVELIERKYRLPGLVSRLYLITFL